MNPKILFAVLLVTVALSAVMAEEEPDVVNTVDELVSKIASASNNETITLAPGVYDLSGKVVTETKNYATAYLKLTSYRIVLRGQNNKHWSLKTPEEETILRGGNKGSIFYAHGQAPRMSAIYNITFENGYQPKNDGNTLCVGGGALSWAASDGCSPAEGYGLVSNCVFRNCGSDYSGGATYGIDAYDCLYTNCYSAANGGGAYGFYKRMANYYHTNLFANCVFVDNIAATNGAALYCREMDMVSGCVFRDNFASNSCGGVYVENSGGIVKSCIFDGNQARRIKSGTQVKNVTMICDSTFSGTGTVHAAEIDRCTFDGAVYGFIDNWNGLITFDAATGNGRIANSLFTECETPRLIVNAGVRADIENCTFAANDISGQKEEKNFVFYAFRTGDAGTPTGTNVIANCLFSSNSIESDSNNEGDWSVNFNVTAGATNIVYNSMYVGGWGGAIPGRHDFTKIDNVADVKFAAGSTKYPTAPHYMPTKYSPAFNAGLVRPWMATGKDLAGNPRIAGDGVDIGCYEWNIPDLGTKIILR